MEPERSSKQCNKCERTLPLDAFSAMKAAPDGRQYSCRDCQKVRWSSMDVEQRRAYRASFEERNPGRLAALQREYAKKSPEAVRAALIKNRYGITIEEWELLYAEQGGRCALCFHEPTKGRSLHTDHCHETGRVRGLLCHHCNHALGQFRERTEVMLRAIAYLEKHRALWVRWC